MVAASIMKRKWEGEGKPAWRETRGRRLSSAWPRTVRSAGPGQARAWRAAQTVWADGPANGQGTARGRGRT
jgi:hypothetical protein